MCAGAVFGTVIGCAFLFFFTDWICDIILVKGVINYEKIIVFVCWFVGGNGRS